MNRPCTGWFINLATVLPVEKCWHRKAESGSGQWGVPVAVSAAGGAWPGREVVDMSAEGLVLIHFDMLALGDVAGSDMIDGFGVVVVAAAGDGGCVVGGQGACPSGEFAAVVLQAELCPRSHSQRSGRLRRRLERCWSGYKTPIR